MRYFIPLILLFNLTLNYGLGAQKALAVADFDVLADSLLADYKVQELIDVLSDRHQSTLKNMIEVFNRNCTRFSGGCYSAEGYEKAVRELKAEQENIEAYVKRYDGSKTVMEIAASSYADTISSWLVEKYSSLEESLVVVPKESVLYRSDDVPDLTHWLLAYSRSEENIKEMIDFREVISKSLNSLE